MRFSIIITIIIVLGSVYLMARRDRCEWQGKEYVSMQCEEKTPE